MSGADGANIRPLVADDRDALAAIIASDETFTAEEHAVALELIDASIDGSTDYEVLVAADGDGPAGYLCFGRTPMTERSFDLYWVVVHAQRRGRGLARRLVEAMEAALRARGGGNVRVETSETEGYGAARALYERLGYPEAARLVDFYRPGDALITYYKVL